MTNILALGFVIITLNSLGVNGKLKLDPDFVCSAKGRFADDTDLDCQRYHLCSVGANGKWTRTSYECPSDTVFDRVSRRCSADVECKHQLSDEDLSSLFGPGGTEFACKRVGRFDDVKDHTCRRYHECVPWKGSFYSTQEECPPGSRFDPKHGKCSNGYQCNREFHCTKTGRFPDHTDSNKYILCSKQKDGRLIKTSYNCPRNTKFDLELNLCTYHSDENSEDGFLNLAGDSPFDRYDPTECHERGYYVNPKDKSSRTYFICDVTADGKLFRNIAACPNNYGFSKETKMCFRKH